MYAEQKASAICESLANGESLRAICQAEGMPDEATVRGWVIDDVQGFAAKYNRARNIALDCMADGTISIADDLTEDPASRRIRFDARRWYLSKLAPKRYGDRIEIAGDPDNPLNVNVTQSAELLTNRIDRLIARSETESVPGEPE